MKRWLGVLGLAVALPFVMADSCGGSGGTPAGSTSSGAPSPVAVGTAMKSSDGEQVTVTAFKRDVAAGPLGPAKAGMECMSVTFALLNGSSSEWLDPTGELQVVDSNGQKYDSLTVECPNSDNVSSLVAGGHANATEYYEVPKGIALDAVWESNLLTGEAHQTALK